jgi:hypothetical protein
MAATEITAANTIRYNEVADPTCEIVNLTPKETGDWFYSKWKFVDVVLFSPNSSSWAAANAYSPVVSLGNKITFTCISTATRPFWLQIYGHD